MSRLTKAEEIIEKLKQSPLYNLSVTNLENFHTAFWKWVGDNYPLDFVKIFDDSLKIRSAKYKREKSYTARILDSNGKEQSRTIRLDLEINTNDGDIYIENKLESFPNTMQLGAYNVGIPKNGGKQKFILLSLVPKNAFTLPEPWKYMDYQELYKNFKNVFNADFDYKNDYHASIIEDYIDVVKGISGIFEKTYEQDSLKYDFHNQDKLEELEALGLRDIYVKRKTSELTDFIASVLSKYSPVADLCLYWDLDNKHGTITLEIALGDCNIGVQIEGNQYRYFIATETLSQEQMALVAKELLGDKLWFFDTQSPKGRAKDSDFCSYVTPHYKMFYSYRKIDELFGTQVTFDMIANQVKTDIDRCVELLPEIEKANKRAIQLMEKELEDVRNKAKEQVLRDTIRL